MRTLTLTQETIDLIQLALSIAETKFSNTHKQIVEELINVRINTDKDPQHIQALYYHEMACDLANINDKLSNGAFE